MMTLPPPTGRPAPTWQPGDPLYTPDGMPGLCPTQAALSDCCPPGCWHHHPHSHGAGMRWTPALPALRFRADGLHVTGGDNPELEDPNSIMRGVA